MNKKIIFLGFVLFLGCISGKTKPATDNVAPSSTVVKTSIPQLETTTTTLPPPGSDHKKGNIRIRKRDNKHIQTPRTPTE